MSTGIQGKKRETKELEKKVGIGEVKVIAINPSIEEYKNVLGIELKEDSKATEYLGESSDGNTTLRIDVWVQDVKSEEKNKITFFLEDKERENKDGNKKQYINNVGTCSWAEDEESLPEWFTKREYRIANVGEEDLYNFLRYWLALDYKDADTVLELDWKKLMKGNVKDLKEQVGGELASSFVVMYTVKTVVKDDETKEYQSVYNKAFLPTYAIKQFRLVNYNDEKVISNLKSKKPKDLKPHERFVLTVTGEYGCKDFYYFGDVKEYNPEDNLVASDKVISDEGDDY